MKWHMSAGFITLLCLGLFCSYPALNGQAQAQVEQKITVLTPLGTPPPIELKSMAPRPANLDGKTIYIVDTQYPRTRVFVGELFKVLQERYARTNWILRDKFGGYMDDDQKLWEEIKKKGHGMIMTVGH